MSKPITTTIYLKPFSVPNFVSDYSTDANRRQFSLGELSDETLVNLCDQFKRDVLEKAKSMRNKTDGSVLFREHTDSHIRG